MTMYLIHKKGPHQGKPVPITADLFLIGSNQLCQLRSKLPGVAWQHCALTTRDKKVFIRDLKGGMTLVNDKVMPVGGEWPLHAGDRVALGPFEFLVQFHERALSQQDAEEWALKSLDREAARRGNENLVDEAEPDPLPPTPRALENASSAARALLEKLTAQRGVVQGRFRVTDHGSGLRVLRFNDTFLVEEAEIAFVEDELMLHLEGPPRRYLLDFKNVARMSSAAGEMLNQLRRRIEEHGGSLACCRVRPDLQMIFETIGVIPAVPHFQSKEHALVAPW